MDMHAQNEDVDMAIESGEGSKSSGLAPKRVIMADTTSSFFGNAEAQGIEDVPGCLKESYYKEGVTMLKSVDLNKIKARRNQQ